MEHSGGTYEYRFDKERMVQFLKSIGKENLLKYGYTLGWHSSPRYVQKGDEIYSVQVGIKSIKQDYAEYPILSEHSGYAFTEPSGAYRGFKNAQDKDLVVTIIDDPYKVADTYPIECVITHDDFDNSIGVNWTTICGKAKSSFQIGAFKIRVLLISGRPTLRVEYEKSGRPFNRGDRFELFFASGKVVSLVLKENPSKSFERNVEFYLPLTESDFVVFQNDLLVKTRLYKPKNTDQRIVSENSNYCNQEISQILFNRYSNTFWDSICAAGFSWEQVTDVDTVSTTFQQDPCYVYLMKDTANGYHKIGISNHPEYREGTLQSEKPTIELVCARQYPSRAIASAIESALHTAFAEKRLRGEWFELGENEVNDIIQTLK